MEGKYARNIDICREEILNAPLPFEENGKPVENDDDGEEDEREPGRIRLESGLEDELITINALRLKSFIELQVRDGYADPGEQ